MHTCSSSGGSPGGAAPRSAAQPVTAATGSKGQSSEVAACSVWPLGLLNHNSEPKQPQASLEGSFSSVRSHACGKLVGPR